MAVKSKLRIDRSHNLVFPAVERTRVYIEGGTLVLLTKVFFLETAAVVPTWTPRISQFQIFPLFVSKHVLSSICFYVVRSTLLWFHTKKLMGKQSSLTSAASFSCTFRTEFNNVVYEVLKHKEGNWRNLSGICGANERTFHHQAHRNSVASCE